MGLIFQRQYWHTHPDGTRERRTCDTWTIRYHRGGRAHQESGFETKTDAKRTLQSREGKIADGVPVSASAQRKTFDEAARDVVNDYKANDKRSLRTQQQKLAHLERFFGGRRLADIGAADIRAYIAHRQAQTTITRPAHDRRLPNGTVRRIPAQTRTIARVSNAQINRELAALKRCFSLAVQASGGALAKPPIQMLREAPPRAGFFDAAQLEAVCARLPAALQPVVRFAFETGWRVPSEVLTLEWRQVDFAAGEVRLDAGMTKNGEPRVFPLTRDLRLLLETQQTERERLQKAGHLCPRVFFRLVAKGRGGAKAPKPITTFDKAWDTACRKAGYPGRIPHDFRRSAIRRMVRAGIPERVAMQMSGHETRSVFERYNITSPGDLRDAARALDRDSIGTVAARTATAASETA